MGGCSGVCHALCGWLYCSLMVCGRLKDLVFRLRLAKLPFLRVYKGGLWVCMIIIWCRDHFRAAPFYLLLFWSYYWVARLCVTSGTRGIFGFFTFWVMF
jgi:hypothetical protein